MSAQTQIYYRGKVKTYEEIVKSFSDKVVEFCKKSEGKSLLKRVIKLWVAQRYYDEDYEIQYDCVVNVRTKLSVDVIVSKDADVKTFVVEVNPIPKKTLVKALELSKYAGSLIVVVPKIVAIIKRDVEKLRLLPLYLNLYDVGFEVAPYYQSKNFGELYETIDFKKDVSKVRAKHSNISKIIEAIEMNNRKKVDYVKEELEQQNKEIINLIKSKFEQERKSLDVVKSKVEERITKIHQELDEFEQKTYKDIGSVLASVKWKKPKVEKQVIQETKKKIIPDEPEYIQKYFNINYCQNKEARLEMLKIVDFFQKIPKVTFDKQMNHDLVIKHKGRIILKLCPLRHGWSACVKGGHVKKYNSIADLFKEISKAIC